MDLIQTMLSVFYWYFRPIIKWFLRRTTRLCELQRICYGESAGAARTCAVENSLKQSRNAQIHSACDELDRLVDEHGASDDDVAKKEKASVEATINVILTVKKIKKDLHIQFVHSMRNCLNQIWGYKRLVHQVESLRATAYDPNNLVHERSLLHLWSLLQPGVPLLSRVTKQWQNIGFQGEDPKTDFRGMGLLGLENLLYFAKEYNSAAKHILSHSHHPKHGYSFAIVGINLTHMAYRLLNDGSAKSHVFNVTTASHDGDLMPALKHFHHFYCYLFVEFDKFWMSEKPRDVMEFNRIRDLFENNVRTLLRDTSTCLRINIAVDTV